MNICKPLELVNHIATKHPACWGQVEEFIRGKNAGELQWDDRCYIPIAAGIAIASNGASLSGIEDEHIRDATIIAATAPWRLYKQIFSFDVDIETLLYDQADDLVIPVEVLNNIPYKCIYIETKLFNDIDGFFVHFESDINDRRLELRFLIVENDMDVFTIAIHLRNGNTIKDGIDQMYEETKKIANQMVNIFSYNINKSEDKERERIYKVATKLMQLVLYICAENKEISEDEKQAKITKIPKSKEFIKDRFREIKKWNCGNETGNIIRGIYEKNNYVHYQKTERSRTGSPKRPHVRRAHWHHYWTGPKNGEQKIKLKWIAPTFIHGNEIENGDIVKINLIKKK